MEYPNIKFFVIDNNTMCGELIKLTLENYGFKKIDVFNDPIIMAKNLFSLSLKLIPDIIVSDFNFFDKELNGVTLIDKIREVYPNINGIVIDPIPEDNCSYHVINKLSSTYMRDFINNIEDIIKRKIKNRYY